MRRVMVKKRFILMQLSKVYFTQLFFLKLNFVKTVHDCIFNMQTPLWPRLDDCDFMMPNQKAKK